ncbi:carboxyl-terminal processing protease [Chitinophaga ginsengisegetis]|uniref:Carboxyl-terminal processing protease n=1 Tax=Chitinophaga ginsengisegetis TaxID=393003 RepID=A0A1T5NZ38_9BACT|nr:carboxy terminal-processing peptidase [Chitinophaga ginsengisegetis]MDR6567094.1 carboxyl-terminal processing protease [Chitinophaga ginsengisegetis]MDR6646824.1 carboxyl-terminal processing protease [Chitinophaga ginsengisegetis]MDR6653174.1 carboxyl-terminal processing protease [Chitinophaga ginsengisegetis]SKD05692.1 carboxyl-terminal processing protease [Chitinophaga ginsengisegetis]
MRLKVIIPVVLLSISAGVLAFNKLGHNDDPPGRYEVIMNLVGQMLKEGHYQPKAIDDKFSTEVFNKYLRSLDTEKKFFLKTDVDKLMPLAVHIDDELKGAPIDCFRSINTLIKQRVAEAAAIYPEILSKPFDFTVDEKVTLDPDKVDFPADENARKEAWRKVLKYRTLEKLTDLQEMREKDKGKDSIKTKTDVELEAEARVKVKQLYDRYFERLKNRQNDNDRFNLYVNAITTTMDPHTDYFPPDEKRAFEEQMAGKFFGIGAQLKEEGDKIRVVSIVTGSPSWKQGQLKANDVIQKVAQGNTEPVDITGYPVEDAVKLIRGKKGTPVKLTVRSVDGTTKDITIIRDEIVTEETFAKSAIINGQHKIGYIYLPEFYADFNDRNGARSAEDVAKEVAKLKAENVEGIILDLRFNGGGSLQDVVQMAGLFIPEGPVVQVRSRGGDAVVLRDRDKNVQYEGPLAIMVNEYSASASEIMAAAMQDYKRAVIIGSTQTFGKGTVQRLFNLDDFYPVKDGGSLGALKLTQQKFYRANGGSTQLKGVASDIVLPDPYYEVAERKDSDALAWDEIPRASFTAWYNPVNAESLKKNSEKRMASSAAFKLLNENLNTLKKLEKQETYSLNLQTYKTEQKTNTAALKKYDAVNDKVKELNIINIKSDMEKFGNDSSKIARNKDWIRIRTKDIYLDEAVNVMNDLIVQSLPKMQRKNQ